MTGQLLATLALLLGNAFFVGAEFALVSARRAQIEPRAQAGSHAARTTLRAMEQVTLMMTGAQLGITVCSLGLGAIGEPAVAHLIAMPLGAAGVPDPVLAPLEFVVALGIVVYLHMVIGEMVPKNITLALPDRAAMLLGPALYLVVRILKPAIWVLNAMANRVVRIVGVEPREELRSTYDRDEVAALLAESQRTGWLDATEYDLVAGALDFPDRTVASVLIPTRQAVTVPADATPSDVVAEVERTGFSRFPVTGEAGDLRGYLHLKDVLDDERDAPTVALPSQRIRPLVPLGSSDPLHLALQRMQHDGAHLGCVTSSKGTTLGIVAFEDLLEELVGEIHEVTRKR